MRKLRIFYPYTVTGKLRNFPYTYYYNNSRLVRMTTLFIFPVALVLYGTSMMKYCRAFPAVKEYFEEIHHRNMPFTVGNSGDFQQYTEAMVKDYPYEMVLAAKAEAAKSAK